MENFEGIYREKGYKLIAGIDEVGRGCLFGDVVAAAVIMPSNSEPIEGIMDSKKLSDKKRAYLYDKILENALAVGIGKIPPSIIDTVNIKVATHLAMCEAIEDLKDGSGKIYKPDLLLIDAEKVETNIEQVSIVKGDALCYSIACASIVAKVYRDRLCIKWASLFPGYGIEKHKGYGTKYHMEMIEKNGPTLLHRRTFLKRFI